MRDRRRHKVPASPLAAAVSGAQAKNGTAVLKLYPDTDHGNLLVALARGRKGRPPVMRDILVFVTKLPIRSSTR